MTLQDACGSALCFWIPDDKTSISSAHALCCINGNQLCLGGFLTCFFIRFCFLLFLFMICLLFWPPNPQSVVHPMLWLVAKITPITGIHAFMFFVQTKGKVTFTLLFRIHYFTFYRFYFNEHFLNTCLFNLWQFRTIIFFLCIIIFCQWSLVRYLLKGGHVNWICFLYRVWAWCAIRKTKKRSVLIHRCTNKLFDILWIKISFSI